MEPASVGTRSRLDVGRAAFWSLTWAAGVGIGVAVGGWLTLVGGSGAPGIGSLDVTHDLIVLPLLSGAVVFVVLFAGSLLFRQFRRHAS